ncbi:hypothetical protein QL093DRAFT_2089731 [Fusarium oxysporum]|nr:hypothetical protein QL093DRAFT_2089731 [Fusarium oxysporum]
MSSPYYHCLAPGVYDGVIDGIQVRWQPAAIPTLDQDALTHGVPVDTLKRMCEHLGHLLARQLRSSRATINVDSRTGKKTDDGDHITVEVSGGEYGRRKCHVYLEGHGQGEGKYDNIRMRALERTRRDVFRMAIGWGMAGHIYDIITGLRDGKTKSDGRGEGEAQGQQQAEQAHGGSTYGTTAGGAGSSSSGQGGTYSDWQLAGDGRTYIRYNYGDSGMGRPSRTGLGRKLGTRQGEV